MDVTRSGISVLTANIFNALFQFSGIIYFARSLNPEEIGIYFLFQASLAILAIPADLGIRGAVEKRISEGEPAQSIVSSALVIKTIPIVCISAGLFFMNDMIAKYIGADVTFILIATVVAQEIAQLMKKILAGELRVEITAYLIVARRLTWLLSGVFLFNFGFSVKSMIYAELIGYTIMASIGIMLISTNLGTPTLEGGKSLLEYSKYNFISSVGSQFYNWIDVAIIGFFLSQSSVGIYEISWRITLVATLFMKAVEASIFPQISQWSADGNNRQIEKLINNVISVSQLFVIPAFFGTAVLGKDILGIVFGPEYISGWLVLIVLMGEKIVHVLYAVFRRTLEAIDRPDLSAYVVAAVILINLILNTAFVQYYGILGVAVATTISFGIGAILYGRYVSKFLFVEIDYNLISWGILCSVFMTFLVLLIKELTQINTILDIILLVTVSAVIYISVLFANNSLRAMAITNAQNILPNWLYDYVYADG